MLKHASTLRDRDSHVEPLGRGRIPGLGPTGISGRHFLREVPIDYFQAYFSE
jgi:hypothetical protein